MDAPTDDETQRTGSAGSIVSGLTSLENETDDFGKRLLRHGKDQQRINDALRNSQPFRKARPNTRVALTLENLERNQAIDATPRANGPPVNGHRRTRSSASSEQSDPPVNIPREWGRKGKQGTEWLNRLKTPDELVQTEDWQKGDTIYPYKTTFTGDGSPRSVDWAAAAADVPIPSVEDTPSPMAQSRRQNFSPIAMRQRTTSLDGQREWEMSDDFTVGSLLTSTPAVPARSKALDEVRQREIENLNRRAVASSRLDQIKEQSPESTRRPSSAKSFPENDVTNVTSRAEEFSMATVPGHSDERRRSTYAVLETASSSPASRNIKNRASNESLRSARHTTPPSATLADRVSKLNRESQNQRPSPRRHESRDRLPAQLADSVSKIKKEGTPQRPDHQRSDSRELLQQLARVTSASPSPSRNPNTQLQRTSEEKKPSPLSSNANNASQKPDQKLDENLSIATDKSSVSDDAVNVLPENDALDPNTLRQADTSALAKTPRVTGAWIDTPLTRKSPQNLLLSWTSSLPVPRNLFRSTSKIAAKSTSEDPSTSERPCTKQEEQQPSRPRHPPSALAAIIEDARNMSKDRERDDPASESSFSNFINKPHVEPSAHIPPKSETETLDESTIASLEDIIDPKLDYTDTLDLPDMLRTYLQELQDAQSHRQLNKYEREHLREVRDLQSMNTYLRNARTSIKDVERGIKRTEKHLATSENKPAAPTAVSTTVSTPTPTPTPTSQNVALSDGLYHCFAHTEGVCKTCGLTTPHMHALPQQVGIQNGLSQYSVHKEGICRFCGITQPHMHSMPGWLQLWTEFRSLFWSWDYSSIPGQPPPTPTLRNPFPTLRMTRLGRYVGLFLFWYILENWAAYVYAPIHYGRAPPLRWDYYYDANIPYFPLAIPTLLFRQFYSMFLEPTSWIWARPFYAVYDRWAPWCEFAAAEVEWQWKAVFGWGNSLEASTWRMWREVQTGRGPGGPRRDPRHSWDWNPMRQRRVWQPSRGRWRAHPTTAVAGRMADDEILR